jgi:hypothetical protein
VRARRDGRDPRRLVQHRRRAVVAGVAAGAGNKHAAERGAAEGLEHGVVQRRARRVAADGVVDHVDAVGDGLLHGGDDVVVEAIVVGLARLGGGPQNLVAARGWGWGLGGASGVAG